MAKIVQFCLMLAVVGQALLHTPKSLPVNKITSNETLFEHSDDKCQVQAGQLLFLHIMKTGGSSVEEFLKCHCEKVGCSLQLSLGECHDFIGNANCPDGLCATHGYYKQRVAQCGADFENPSKVMTVFREPISRVFSLYNYEKEQGKQLPSITELYQKCDAGDFTYTGFAADMVQWMCVGMTNFMVLKTFSNQHNVYSSEINTAVLDQAKKLVSSLDAVFFLDDLDRFPAAFEEASLITDTYVNPNEQRCEITHANKADCPTCAIEPTTAEEELIRNHNQMDIMLYNFAAGLPNRKGAVPK